MYFPDLGTHSQIASGPHVRAVGWLSLDQVYPKAEPAPELLARLEHFRAGAGDSIRALGWPVAGGAHVCEFCGRQQDSLNFGVPSAELLYICPVMITHYVHAHAYAPPKEFVDAMLASPLPGTLDYALAVVPFNSVLRSKHRDIQVVVCTLGAELGRDHLLAYPSVQDGPNAIWLGDFNHGKPQARLRIETCDISGGFDVRFGHGPFHDQDRFELEQTLHAVGIRELQALVRREFAPWVNSRNGSRAE